MPTSYGRIGQIFHFFVDFYLKLWYISSMKTTNTNKMNLQIVRNVAYSQINKINKNIKEIIEVDKELLNLIDINMKNAVNKIIHDYNFKKINGFNCK
jgi:predicted phage-related endonuclease